MKVHLSYGPKGPWRLIQTLAIKAPWDGEQTFKVQPGNAAAYTRYGTHCWPAPPVFQVVNTMQYV